MNIQPENILIVRTDRIGDLILTLPLAGLIKNQYPNCKVSFLIREYTKNIVSNHPHIDEVIVLRKNNGKVSFSENLSIIKSKKFDSCIVVYPTFLLSLIMFFGGIKNRIGTGYRWYSFLFNHKVYEHRKNAERHELEFNVNLLGMLNITNNVDENNVRYDLRVNQSSLSIVDKILADEKIDSSKPILIVHPGSGGSSMDLPANRFSEMVKLLVSEGYQVIITGNKSEQTLCEEVKAGSNAVNLAGRFSIDELIALISLCSVFISNSTGPIHIAAALNKYVVGFYPKVVSCSKERWGPYTTKKLIYEPSIKCKDCTIEKCKKLNCMDSLDIQNVFTDIKNVLNKNQEK